MEEKIKIALSKSFLFLNIPDSELRDIYESLNIELRAFKKNKIIYSPDSFYKKIGIIIEGKCEVLRIHSDGKIIPLNKLSEASAFGVLAAFGSCDEFPTSIIAKTDCTIAFIGCDEVRNKLLSHPDVSLNIINFMTEKIRFLNGKISTFSGFNVEQKVASYIALRYKNSGALSFEFNKKRCAESIGAGRASLYRALEKLEADGLIGFDNKQIIIKDLNGLERILK